MRARGTPAPAAVPAATLGRPVPGGAVWPVPGAVGGRALRGGDRPAQEPREDRLAAVRWSMRPIRTLPPAARRCLLGCLGSGLPALVRGARWHDWPALAAFGITPAGARLGPPPNDPAMR